VHTLALIGGSSAVHQGRLNAVVASEFLPFFQAVGQVARKGAAGLDAQRLQALSAFDQDIDFVADVVSPKLQLSGATRIQALFHDCPGLGPVWLCFLR